MTSRRSSRETIGGPMVTLLRRINVLCTPESDGRYRRFEVLRLLDTVGEPIETSVLLEKTGIEPSLFGEIVKPLAKERLIMEIPPSSWAYAAAGRSIIALTRTGAMNVDVRVERILDNHVRSNWARWGLDPVHAAETARMIKELIPGPGKKLPPSYR